MNCLMMALSFVDLTSAYEDAERIISGRASLGLQPLYGTWVSQGPVLITLGLSSIPTEPMHRYKSLAIYRIDKAATVSIK